MLSEIGTAENIPAFIEGVKSRWLLLFFFFLFMCLFSLSVKNGDGVMTCSFVTPIFWVSSQPAGKMIILFDILSAAY